ncbi:MAG: GNAT family N-acetyltransferase [Solirubrobacteraceae bacterium]
MSGDRDALGALKLRASLAWGDHPEALRSMPEARSVPAEHLPFAFLAEDAGRILGFATVLAGPGAEAELEDLFVEPELWRRGVGRRLLHEAERRARMLGASSLQLTAGRARGFYAACGFQVVGGAATALGPAVRMQKRLTISSP